MSHVAIFNKVEITDLDALEKAANHLGLKLVKKNTYRWYGRHVGDYPLPEGFTKEQLGYCDYALVVEDKPNAYEVGVVQRGNQFVLLYDFWAGGYGLMSKISSDGVRPDKLTQRYELFEAMNLLPDLGYTYDLCEDETGLRLEVYE